MYKIIISSLFLLYFCGVTPSGIIKQSIADTGFRDIQKPNKSVITRGVATKDGLIVFKSNGKPAVKYSATSTTFEGDEAFSAILRAGTAKDLKIFIDLAKRLQVSINYEKALLGVNKEQGRLALMVAFEYGIEPVEKFNYLWKEYTPEQIQNISEYLNDSDFFDLLLNSCKKSQNNEFISHVAELIKINNSETVYKKLADFAKQNNPVSQKVIKAIIEKEPSIKERLRSYDPYFDLTPTEKLLYAIQRDDFNAVKSAIEDGADLSRTDPRFKNGMPALRIAAENLISSRSLSFRQIRKVPSLQIFQELLKYATPEILNNKYNGNIVMMSLLLEKGDAFSGKEEELAKIFTAFLERYKELGILPDINIDAFKKSYQYNALKDIDVNYDGKVIKFEKLISKLELDLHSQALKKLNWYELGKKAQYRASLRKIAQDHQDSQELVQETLRQHTNMLDKVYEWVGSKIGFIK